MKNIKQVLLGSFIVAVGFQVNAFAKESAESYRCRIDCGSETKTVAADTRTPVYQDINSKCKVGYHFEFKPAAEPTNVHVYFNERRGSGKAIVDKDLTYPSKLFVATKGVAIECSVKSEVEKNGWRMDQLKNALTSR